MGGDWRIVCWVGGGLACLDLAAKAWLLAALLCTTCSPAPLVLTSAAAARLAAPPTERISQAGMRYGHCAGVVLAVVLSPEPCGWEQTPSLLAGR